jgi:triosephosphate isomerase
MLLGTNWKMNKTQGQAAAYASRLRAHVLESSAAGSLELFLIPSVTSLQVTVGALSDTNVKVGVQNIHWAASGPYTGEISAAQAADAGAAIAEIGHSERRTLSGETDEEVKLKVQSAVHNGMIPLICVGEPAAERDDGTAREFVRRQVLKALAGVDAAAAAKAWIAYEPVWAIGEGNEPASADYVYDMHEEIREALRERFGKQAGHEVRLLYGGSVDRTNAADYVNQPNVDGVFVGRAALDVETFIELADSIGELVATER